MVINLVRDITSKDKMSYLVKTPSFCYFIKYFNDSLGFRESKITTVNKSAAKEIESHKKIRGSSKFMCDLEKKGFDIDNIVTKGSFERLFPLHIQLELTNNCNLSCDYCYRDSNYNNANSDYIDLDKLKKFLLKFKRQGLLEVGVTGGEPTLHPEFVHLMKFIIKNFELVELVTNGTNSEILLELLDCIPDSKHKLNLSISFNKWFRELEDFEKGNHYLNRTISKLSKNIPIRIIATDFFYSESKAKKLKDALKKAGVKDIDFSYVAPIGRAKDKITEKENISRFPKSEIKDSFRPALLNCGLIFKHTVMDPKGNLRPCALFSESYVIGSINGFVDEKYRLLNEIPAPNEDICGSCEYLSYCVGCPYKGLFNSNINCSYRKFIKGKKRLRVLI
ncbi:MAG: radical SAM protein [archaeon]